MGGEGVVLPGPGRDQPSQGRIGGEDAVVAVAVDPGWGKDRGEAIEELQGREAERGAAGRVGPREEVEDLVGAAADEVEAVERERRPCTVSDEAFQSGAVGGLDADAGVEAEPAAVIPGEHVVGFVGFQEAMAANVAQHPCSHSVLEALEELRGEGRGFVEAEVGF